MATTRDRQTDVPSGHQSPGIPEQYTELIWEALQTVPHKAEMTQELQAAMEEPPSIKYRAHEVRPLCAHHIRAVSASWRGDENRESKPEWHENSQNKYPSYFFEPRAQTKKRRSKHRRMKKRAGMAKRTRRHERTHAVSRVGVGAGGHKHAHTLCVPASRGSDQRGTLALRRHDQSQEKMPRAKNVAGKTEY